METYEFEDGNRWGYDQEKHYISLLEYDDFYHKIDCQAKRDNLSKRIRRIMKNTKESSFLKNDVIYSDQGMHYMNPQFQKLVKKMELGKSISRRGNCWLKA